MMRREKKVEKKGRKSPIEKKYPPVEAGWEMGEEQAVENRRSSFDDWEDLVDEAEKVANADRPKLGARLLSWLRMERQVNLRHRWEMDEDSRIADGELEFDDPLTEKAPHLRDMTVRTIRQTVERVVGMANSREIEGRVYPAGVSPFGDNEEADATAAAGEFDTRIKHISDMTDFKEKRNQAMRQCVKSGESFLRDGLKYDPDTGGLEWVIDQVDWRQVFCDSRDTSPGIDRARYLFWVAGKDMRTLASIIARKAGGEVKALEMLRKYAYGFDVDVSVDSDLYGGESGGYLDEGLAGNSRRYYDEWEHSGTARELVNHGEVWFYQWIGNRRVCLRQEFITDRGFSGMILIGGARHLYPHNRIPFSRFVFARKDRTGRAFSPIVRFRKGLERALNLTLRTLMVGMSSRSIKMSVDLLSQDEQFRNEYGSDIKKYAEDLREQASQVNPIFLIFGPPDATEITPPDRIVEWLSNVFSRLWDLARENGGISASVTGQDATARSGVALAEEKESAAAVLSELIEHTDSAIESLFERILSNSQSFSGVVGYDSLPSSDGKISFVRGENDVKIDRFKARFRIVADKRPASLQKEAVTIMMTMLQKLDPAIMAAMMPEIVRHIGLPNSEQFRRTMIEILDEMGIPIPKTVLSADERKEREKREQAQAQQAQQQSQIAVAGAEAEVAGMEAKAKRDEAGAMLDMAKASVVGRDGQEKMGGGDERETINNLNERLSQLREFLRSRGIDPDSLQQSQ